MPREGRQNVAGNQDCKLMNIKPLGILSRRRLQLSPLLHPITRFSDEHYLLLLSACDLRPAGAREHIHFAAHSELGQVNSGFNREASIG
jgi:hypothetical protein